MKSKTRNNQPGSRRSSSDSAMTSSLQTTQSHSTTTVSSDTSTNHGGLNNTNDIQNNVKYVAKVIAGAFIACFTPPDDHLVSNNQRPSSLAVTNSSSVSSGSGSVGERRRSMVKSFRSDADQKEQTHAKFTITQIHKATRNFSPSLKIGQGGFGAVYRGTLEDGTLVAVKRAKRSDYGKHLGTEFRCEIEMLSQVEHLNLVRYFGFLEEGVERILVMEYVRNGTLREHLDCLHGDVLDTGARLDIAIDVAHAITYLHMYTDKPIIHRDIKSSNILLTEKRRAKVADFGFARLAADRDSGHTHVSTQVKGTAGYLDPEYLKTYQLTEKSDVYSFGVLLVELVTGRRPIEPKRLAKERITTRWAIVKLTEGDAVSTFDPKLEVTTATNIALEKILELAFTCLASPRQNRPTMKQCGEELWSIRKEYQELSASDACSLSPKVRRSSLTRN